jgi:hypothetical protein
MCCELGLGDWGYGELGSGFGFEETLIGGVWGSGDV